MTPTHSAGTRLTESSPCVKRVLLRRLSSKRTPKEWRRIEGGVRKCVDSFKGSLFPLIRLSGRSSGLVYHSAAVNCEADPPNTPNELRPSPETQTHFSPVCSKGVTGVSHWGSLFSVFSKVPRTSVST